MVKKFYKIFQILVIFICFYILYNILSKEEEAKNILFNFNFYKFIPCVLISILITITYSKLIFNIVSFTTSIKISYKKWQYIFLNSQFLSNIPFLGVFYKAIRLKSYNLDYKYFIYSYLIVYFFFVILNFLFLSVDSLLLFSFYQNINYLFITIIFIIFLVFYIFFIRILNFLFSNHKFKNKLLNKINSLIKLINKDMFNKKTVKVFLKYGLILHILNILIYLFLNHFLQLKLSIENIFIIFLGQTVLSYIRITPNNLGVAEIIAGIITSYLGFNFTTGVILQLFIRASHLLSNMLLFIFNNIFLKEEIKISNI